MIIRYCVPSRDSVSNLIFVAFVYSLTQYAMQLQQHQIHEAAQSQRMTDRLNLELPPAPSNPNLLPNNTLNQRGSVSMESSNSSHPNLYDFNQIQQQVESLSSF